MWRKCRLLTAELPSSGSSWTVSTSGDQDRRLGTAGEVKTLKKAIHLGLHSQVWGQRLPTYECVLDLTLNVRVNTWGAHLLNCFPALPRQLSNGRDLRRGTWRPSTLAQDHSLSIDGTRVFSPPPTHTHLTLQNDNQTPRRWSAVNLSFSS